MIGVVLAPLWRTPQDPPRRQQSLGALRGAPNVQDAARELRTKGSLEDLRNSIKGRLDGVPGVRELYCYDTALGDAANLGHGILPKRVCVHRGTREGGAALRRNSAPDYDSHPKGGDQWPKLRSRQ